MIWSSLLYNLLRKLLSCVYFSIIMQCFSQLEIKKDNNVLMRIFNIQTGLLKKHCCEFWQNNYAFCTFN